MKLFWVRAIRFVFVLLDLVFVLGMSKISCFVRCGFYCFLINSCGSYSRKYGDYVKIRGIEVQLRRAVATAPQTPQLGGPTQPKGASNCLKGSKVASIQRQNFSLRIALNGIFCAHIIYFTVLVLKFFAIVSF